MWLAGWSAGSLTACLAVEISPGSYSVSVMECADEGERTGGLVLVVVGGGGDSQIKLLVPCGIKIRGGAYRSNCGSGVTEPPCSGLESSSVVQLLLCISLCDGHLKKPQNKT